MGGAWGRGRKGDVQARVEEEDEGSRGRGWRAESNHSTASTDIERQGRRKGCEDLHEK